MNKIEAITDEKWSKVRKENRNIVEEYLKQSVNLSDYTLTQYESALKIYFYWIHENKDDKLFYEIKSRDYLHYQNFLTEMGLSSSAIKFKRSAVSTLNNYISIYYQDEYPLFRNYINKAISSPAPNPVNEKHPLTLEEYSDLCEKLEEKELWQVLAYVKFSFSSGARRNEVRQLLKEVIDYTPRIVKDNEVYTTHKIRCKGRSKIGKIRNLNFDKEAMDAIKKWIEVRGEDDCKHVFVSGKGKDAKNVSESAFNIWCKSYIEPIIGRRFHPHAFRSSRATTLTVEKGADITVAQKLLGHASAETTRAYVVRNDENDSDDAFF